MSARISILMPVYNASPFLTESINSVLQQSYVDFEFIIIDDGSTDGSKEIVSRYKDERIRFIQLKHDFINSLNYGLKEATGEYIARMDSDDVMLPQRLQTQFTFMEAHPEVDICGSWAEMFDKQTGMIRRPVAHTDIISLMLVTNPMMHPTVMIRHASLLKTGCCYQKGYSCAEDYKLWIDLIKNGLCFANIPEPLIRYRVSELQVTAVSRDRMRQSSLKIRMEYAEFVINLIVEKDDKYSDYLNALVELYNTKRICKEAFLQTVYILYGNVLEKIEQL